MKTVTTAKQSSQVSEPQRWTIVYDKTCCVYWIYHYDTLFAARQTIGLARWLVRHEKKKEK